MQQPKLEPQDPEFSYMPPPTLGIGCQNFTEEERRELQLLLGKSLGPEYASTRPGPGGTKLTYVEGWKVKNLMNEIFGFDGWRTKIDNLVVDYMDILPDGKVSVGASAILRVTLKDGTYHEGVGYGTGVTRDKSGAFEKAKKEAATDALKRAVVNFGMALGNCMYDNEWTKFVTKLKTTKVQYTEENLLRSVGSARLTHLPVQQPSAPLESTTTPTAQTSTTANMNQNQRIPNNGAQTKHHNQNHEQTNQTVTNNNGRNEKSLASVLESSSSTAAHAANEAGKAERRAIAIEKRKAVSFSAQAPQPVPQPCEPIQSFLLLETTVHATEDDDMKFDNEEFHDMSFDGMDREYILESPRLSSDFDTGEDMGDLLQEDIVNKHDTDPAQLFSFGTMPTPRVVNGSSPSVTTTTTTSSPASTSSHVQVHVANRTGSSVMVPPLPFTPREIATKNVSGLAPTAGAVGSGPNKRTLIGVRPPPAKEARLK